jgi:glycosyltransferase involved in cell wall biosynthesis
VPCLNEEVHLPFFLMMLAQQSWRGFELIVVDGGSADNSREIVDAYSEAFDCGCTKLINTRRNLGFIRNLGARAARGEILLFTNSDAVLPRNLLKYVAAEFEDPVLQALSGRTIPLDGGALCFAGYHCFDLLRLLFFRLGRFSPSGNFLAIRRELFWKVGGFPEVKVNEDGELGSRISRARAAVKFEWRLKVWHFAKRFKRGSLKTLLFYSYVFGNFSPKLKRVLKYIEGKSSREFDKK